MFGPCTLQFGKNGPWEFLKWKMSNIALAIFTCVKISPCCNFVILADVVLKFQQITKLVLGIYSIQTKRILVLVLVP